MAGTIEAEAPGDAAVAFRATASEAVISTENTLCGQIKGRIQARTARLASASVYEPIPKRGESLPAAAPAAGCSHYKDLSFLAPNVRPDVGVVPGSPAR